MNLKKTCSGRPVEFYGFILFLSLAVLFFSCEESSVKTEKYEYQIPADLGKALFFDVRLSSDNTISCGTCHLPERAFTDGKEVAVGVGGRKGMRNVPTLINVKNMHAFMFDSKVPTLEMQAIVPIQDTNEMNIPMSTLIEKLSKIESYRKAAEQLYHRKFDAYVLSRSISAYERTIVSTGSPFDDYLNGNEKSISESAKRGWKLFSEKLYCTECHRLPDFSTHESRNNGYLGDTTKDFGRYRATGIESDKNKFKVPGLRNIALTGPYMHDGKLKSLSEVIHQYSSGKKHFQTDPRIMDFDMDRSEEVDLIHFLESLTDKKLRLDN